MSTQIIVEATPDKEYYIDLYREVDGVKTPVTFGSVTAAKISIGGISLSTTEGTIQLWNHGGQASILVKLGGVDLDHGHDYRAYVTAIDSSAPTGYPAGDFIATVQRWPIPGDDE